MPSLLQYIGLSLVRVVSSTTGMATYRCGDSATIWRPFDTYHILYQEYRFHLITSGSRGAHPARPPPLLPRTYVLYAQNAIFSQIFLRSLRSRFILSIILIEIWPKTRKNNAFYLTINTFNDFLPPPPPPRSTPPLRSNPGSATDSMMSVWWFKTNNPV